jgi:hypothetical protein
MAVNDFSKFTNSTAKARRQYGRGAFRVFRVYILLAALLASATKAHAASSR